MSWEKNYLNAIVILKNGLAAKYHNIRKERMDKFELYVRKKFPTADHINYYPKNGGRCELSKKM
jgi:hypothetical protein